MERRRVGSWLEDVPSARHQFVLNLATAGWTAPVSRAQGSEMPFPEAAVSEVPFPEAPGSEVPFPEPPGPEAASSEAAGSAGPAREAVGSGSTVPPGYRDFAQAARPHLGVPPPVGGVDADSAATVDGTTFGEYGEVASELARVRGIGAGDRVLFDTAAQEEPLIWLMAPLTAGASIVLCANLDRSLLDERVKAEVVTRLML